MVDVVDPATRSWMMAGIKGGDTKPEIMVRQYLHACGFRFRLHRRDLPGRPDIVLPKQRLVIFVHGCFWHRHPGCRYASTPSTRPEFWQRKFENNIARDQRNLAKLRQEGWRVFVLWECGLRHSSDELVDLPVWTIGHVGFREWPSVPPRRKDKACEGG